MKGLRIIGIFSARLLTVMFLVFPYACQVLAESEKMDVQTFLPLFERNSIVRKVLEVSYSFVCGSEKKDVRLVFDAESGKYYEQEKIYESPETTNVYRLNVVTWDGKEYVRWLRHVSERPGYRALGQGVYEDTGQASIRNGGDKTPYFAEIFYDSVGHPFTKSVLHRNPQLGSLSGDTITIDTTANKFEFSEKSGALEKLVSYTYTKDRRKVAWVMRDLSGHVEQSGVWIPLRIVALYHGVGKTPTQVEISVDPKTLRLLDKADASLFNVSFPMGCSVDDHIRKKSYTVTAIDTLPQDVEAMKKTLEKMLEQAEEQKAAAEQK